MAEHIAEAARRAWPELATGAPTFENILEHTVIVLRQNSLPLRRAEILPTVVRRFVAMAHAMGLHVVGIDLRRTPDDQSYCLEVNPSPGTGLHLLRTENWTADLRRRRPTPRRPMGYDK